MWWQYWGNASQMVTAATGIVALGLGIYGWKESRKARERERDAQERQRRALKRDLVNDLYREYTKEEMGKAVQSLHEAFRTSTGKQPEKEVSSLDRRAWVEHYEQVYRSADFTLHYQRRMVSGFYQRAAFSTEEDPLMKGIVLGLWGDKNLFVKNVLLPIETIALPELLYGTSIHGEPSRNDWPLTWRRVSDFWGCESP